MHSNHIDYKDIVEKADELICRHLPDTTLTFVNDTYCNYYRKSRKELIGSSFLQFLSPKEQERIVELLSRLSVKTPVIIDEKEIITPWNKERRWQHWSNKAIFDDVGNVVMVQSVARDITERRKAELALQESEGLLKQQKEELQNKNIALREIMEQIGEEKKQIINDVLTNLETVIMPILVQTRLAGNEQVDKYVTLLERTLHELAGSFGRHISDPLLKLTPREIDISNMVRSGFSTKEIADILHISAFTVEGHRNRIRKKLKITNEKINLETYLQNLG